MTSLLVADRSERGKLRFSGEQDLWFLHQIMTQSYEDMTVGEARDTAMLTAHGRMVGYMETIRTADGVLAHFEPSLREDLPEAIRRYVFATRVDIDDVVDSYGLLLVTGDGWREAVPSSEEVVVHPTRGLGVEAAYLWVAAERKEEVLEGLRAAGARDADEDDLEAIRIAHGVPRWGFEMDLKTIPQEAGVHAWAVNFDKGCYVGQEAMAKIHFRGKVNRRLAQLEGPGLEQGMDVSLDGDKVGVVTSAAGERGLAKLRHTVEPGTLVTVGGHDVKVRA